jgi:hypothetical protein
MLRAMSLTLKMLLGAVVIAAGMAVFIIPAAQAVAKLH